MAGNSAAGGACRGDRPGRCAWAEGSLAPRFVVVANVQSADGGAAIVAGNERVLRARLADPKFFRDRDRTMKLRDRLASLADITFPDRLRALAAKVARLEVLACATAACVPASRAEPAGAVDSPAIGIKQEGTQIGPVVAHPIRLEPPRHAILAAGFDLDVQPAVLVGTTPSVGVQVKRGRGLVPDPGIKPALGVGRKPEADMPDPIHGHAFQIA